MRWLALACCVAASAALTLPPSVSSASSTVRAAPASAAAAPRATSGNDVRRRAAAGGVLTNGAKSVSVGAGSSLMAACKKLGINVKTNCKKGDCGTCTVNVGGKSMRACIGKVPPAPKLKSVQEKGLPVR